MEYELESIANQGTTFNPRDALLLREFPRDRHPSHWKRKLEQTSTANIICQALQEVALKRGEIWLFAEYSCPKFVVSCFYGFSLVYALTNYTTGQLLAK